MPLPPSSPDAATAFTVAVRPLCEFTARVADIDVRFAMSPSAQEGMAGHAAVTANRLPGYEKEISLQDEHGGLRVRGRADGYDPGRQALEEIKTYRGDLAAMPAAQRALHWAQARIYGWLLCRQRGLERLTVSLVYYDLSSQHETVLSEVHTADALRGHFEMHCARFMAWAVQEAAHRAARDHGLANLEFPHGAFREGQRTLARAVYRATRDGGCVAIEAPTGIGKTLGTLYPMLRAAPAGRLDKLYYLAARTPGRQLALTALRALLPPPSTAGMPRVLELVARDKACERPGSACTGDDCALARGFYDRLPAARAQAVRQSWLDRDALRRIAADHQVCPYYLGQEMLRWSDVIVGDFNYYFDHTAILYAMATANDWHCGVLVDEAHNLVERARDMYSAHLRQTDLADLARSIPALAASWRGLDRAWRELNGGVDAPYAAQAHIAQDFISAVQATVARIAEHVIDHGASSDPALQRFYFDALHLLRLADRFGAHSLFEVRTTSEPPTHAPRGIAHAPRRMQSIVGIRNVVPAPHLASRWSGARVAVLFSGTLGPAAYYHDMLGLPAGCARIEVASPFTADQLAVRISRHVSTRYTHREASLTSITDLMAAQFAARPGNYLAFFSSFSYLESAARHLAARHPGVACWRQQSGMDEAAREAFLARFVPGGMGIGFAVLGGAFSEGIDLPGDRLVGAFIATLGLPQVNPPNDAMRERLEAMFGPDEGFAYAYLYPGLRKVVQAAGRVIRTPDDRGVLHLMDDRFARRDVRALLPVWWDQKVVQSSSSAIVAAADAVDAAGPRLPAI